MPKVLLRETLAKVEKIETIYEIANDLCVDSNNGKVRFARLASFVDFVSTSQKFLIKIRLRLELRKRFLVIITEIETLSCSI